MPINNNPTAPGLWGKLTRLLRLTLTAPLITSDTSVVKKPIFLIEQVGMAPSTAWSSIGTCIGVNVPSSVLNSLNLIDLQYNGTSVFKVSGAGKLTGGTFFSGTNSTESQNGHFVTNSGLFGFTSSSNPGATADTALSRAAAGVLRAHDGTNAFWMQNTAGLSVLTANVTNATATLATTGLTVTVKAGRKYSFIANLPIATAAVLEGIKVAVSGTATITNLVADIQIASHATPPVWTLGRVSAFDAAIGQTVADAGNATVQVYGTLECNAAGTMRLDFAKNASTGATNTTLLRGAYFVVEDMP